MSMSGEILNKMFDSTAGNDGAVKVTMATALAGEDVTTGALRTERAYMEQSSLSAGALNDLLVPVTDVSAYSSFSLQITGTFTATLALEISNDNSNWTIIRTMDLNAAASGLSITGTGFRGQNLPARYMRVRMTAYTSGTANGKVAFFTQPLSLL